MKKRALMWVADTQGVVTLAAQLIAIGWDVISISSTTKVLHDGGVKSIPAEDITGFPDSLGGCRNAFHPKILGGIEADRGSPSRMEALYAAGGVPIDMVVANQIDFRTDPRIENIDIGRTTLLRAAAKNAASVIPLVNPSDYNRIAAELASTGDISESMRQRLSFHVFLVTGRHETDISLWMGRMIDRKQPFLSSFGAD